MLPGNHDYRKWGGEPSLLETFENLADNIEILKDGVNYLRGDFPVYCSSYKRNPKNLLSEYHNGSNTDDRSTRIFLGHQDIIGVNYGGFVVENGLDPAKLANLFEYSFIGHCHDAFVLDENVISVGAPLQHSFTDVSGSRGWWIYDSEAVEKVKFFPNKFSPQFYDIEITDDIFGLGNKINPDKDFVRITVPAGPLPDAVGLFKNKRIIRKIITKKANRTTISLSDSKADIIKKYVELKIDKKKFDKEKLIELGRELL